MFVKHEISGLVFNFESVEDAAQFYALACGNRTTKPTKAKQDVELSTEGLGLKPLQTALLDTLRESATPLSSLDLQKKLKVGGNEIGANMRRLKDALNKHTKQEVITQVRQHLPTGGSGFMYSLNREAAASLNGALAHS